VELDEFPRHCPTDFRLEAIRPYGDGAVTGYGTVDGRPVAVFSQNSTVFGGAPDEVYGQEIIKVKGFSPHPLRHPIGETMNTVHEAIRHTVSASRTRVVVAKPGLDGHDRGAKVIARALRDAGHEVIYTGLHQTPEQIVAAVIAEDACVLGLSILSGAHLTIVQRVIELLAQEDAGDVRILVGGIIPDADVTALEAMGVDAVFTPGADIRHIVETVNAFDVTGTDIQEPTC
jgi:methylmalonyl-CoA mutase C-terminal domain/subunit